MKKTIAYFSIFTLMLISVVSSGVSLDAASHNQPQRVIVLFDEPVNNAAQDALEAHGHVLNTFNLINGALVVLPDTAAVNVVSNLDGVVSVETDSLVYAQKPPGACDPWPDCKNGGDDDGSTDPSQPAQTMEWGVDRIDADLTWGTSTGSGVNVAVIDTGIDLDHADLNVVRGVDCTKGPNCDKGGSGDDDNGHGTHVAGIIGALNNDIGVVGVAPDANLYGVKVLNSKGSGFLSDVIEGIEWSVNNGADVINMSLGSSSSSQAMHDAVDAAYNAGVVIVASAGNSGDGDPNTNDVGYPAKYSSVIAISATASDDSTPSWSSEGAEVEVAAPGVNVRSTWNDGLYYTASGTSMASPHTAGTVALMLSNGVASSDVRSLLQATADDLGATGFDNHYGYGLTDAEEATTGIATN
ncbi:MAG: S8 family peptidase [Candidatus Spechtbacterales bacterium]|nr:S8 family peptidase [Candidatus Spechtbacterales bacterium]